MAAMVQTFPSQPSTMTMMQSRSPSADAYQNLPRNHPRNSHMPQNMYASAASGIVHSSYRGNTITSPIPPYAFTTTPSVNAPTRANPLQQNPPPPQLRPDDRTSSAPVVPQSQQSTSSTVSSRAPILSLPFQQNGQGPAEASRSSPNTTPLTQRPLSSIDLNPPALTAASTTNPSKPSPDRYRRVQRRADTVGGYSNVQPVPAGAGAANGGGIYMNPTQANSSPTLSPYPAYRGSPSAVAPNPSNFPPMPSRTTTMDDMSLPRSQHEGASRYRRRSISGLDVGEHTAHSVNAGPQQPALQKSYAAMLAGPAPPTSSTPRSFHAQLENRVTHTYPRPGSAHERHGSVESTNSTQSSSTPASVRSHPMIQASALTVIFASKLLRGNMTISANVQSQARREAAAPVSTHRAAQQQNHPITQNQVKLVNIPPRGSSDANKRIANPSPLSKPVAMSPDPARTNEAPFAAVVQGKITPSEDTPADAPVAGVSDSPAAQHLAAVSKKDEKKQGKSSRLRRAFSFGSAAELRKASAENSVNNSERAKLRKSQYATEEAQQAAIAQKQEASGLGEGIYSGQGNFFTGSTDNLSISSTASSASVMIRKMGKGLKRGSRSMVGLFRPKSVVGVPPPDAAPEPSIAQVSMVTVEAEREKVNVNANASEQSGGGTGFPKLERNSLDAASVANESTVSARSDGTGRRSIVGGEKERAEVLAAVKKGILKSTLPVSLCADRC